jgi:hypothetical protein
MAESELGVLTSQYLDRRIPDKDTLTKEVSAWEDERNATHTKANWRFATGNRPHWPSEAGDLHEIVPVNGMMRMLERADSQ